MNVEDSFEKRLSFFKIVNAKYLKPVFPHPQRNVITSNCHPNNDLVMKISNPAAKALAQSMDCMDLRFAVEAFIHAHMALTGKPDEILAQRGLARVHHRILFFVARWPDLSVKQLLAALRVSKQAINVPLRQLLEAGLVEARADMADKRVKRLSLTPQGAELEKRLHHVQAALLQQAFKRTGTAQIEGWLRVNEALAQPGYGAG